MKLDDLQIRALLVVYNQRKYAIQARLKDFSRVPPSEYFYELAYCLMTPQSSAVHADRVVAILRENKFLETGFDPEEILRRKEHYIRFHRNKSRYLLLTRQSKDVVLSAVKNMRSSASLRDWLVKNVKGLGYKEASHFLRNIGRNDGLAILDRHILRNLQRHRAIRTIPASVTRKQYLSIEKRFKIFAETIGIPLDELDLLFWSMETGEIRK
jgi:N-glycosylase/DNA lyase